MFYHISLLSAVHLLWWLSDKSLCSRQHPCHVWDPWGPPWQQPNQPAGRPHRGQGRTTHTQPRTRQETKWVQSPGPVFCLLLGVSSDYAQPITGQVTEVTCPVIGRAQPELTPSKRQKTGPGLPGHHWHPHPDGTKPLPKPVLTYHQ